jgi:hypothetical protein
MTCPFLFYYNLGMCPAVQLTPEEAEFLKRREAARQRVAQRTAQNFGFI